MAPPQKMLSNPAIGLLRADMPRSRRFLVACLPRVEPQKGRLKEFRTFTCFGFELLRQVWLAGCKQTGWGGRRHGGGTPPAKLLGNLHQSCAWFPALACSRQPLLPCIPASTNISCGRQQPEALMSANHAWERRCLPSQVNPLV
jgi:hypothetical protein